MCDITTTIILCAVGMRNIKVKWKDCSGECYTNSSFCFFSAISDVSLTITGCGAVTESVNVN